jgi:hypothetical protein
MASNAFCLARLGSDAPDDQLESDQEKITLPSQTYATRRSISPKISRNSSNFFRIETPRSERIRFSANVWRHSVESKLVVDFCSPLSKPLKK